MLCTTEGRDRGPPFDPLTDYAPDHKTRTFAPKEAVMHPKRPLSYASIYQLAKMSFDKIFDLTAGVYFYFL